MQIQLINTILKFLNDVWIETRNNKDLGSIQNAIVCPNETLRAIGHSSLPTIVPLAMVHTSDLSVYAANLSHENNVGINAKHIQPLVKEVLISGIQHLTNSIDSFHIIIDHER